MTTAPDRERMNSMAITIASFGPLWASQGAINLAEIAKWPTVAKLKDVFKDKPAVIIAPGPSLSKNLELLRDLKGRAVLIAFSRCLEILRPAGIVPDLVVVLDPLDLLFHFEGYPVEELEGIVIGMTCNRNLFRLPVKRVFTFSGNATVESWLYEALDGFDTFLDTSCSVATTTTSLAVKMGCDPIIYVGQDLSFSGNRYYDKGSRDGGARLEAFPQPDAHQLALEAAAAATLELLESAGSPHAAMGRQKMTAERDLREQGVQVTGFSEDSKKVEASGRAVLSRIGRVVKVPGYYGGKVKCTPSFSWVGEWLEKRIADHKKGRFINATEGGRKIEGCIHAPLATVIDGGEVRLGTKLLAELEPLANERLDVPGTLQGIVDSIDVKAQRKALMKMAKRNKRSLVRAHAYASKLLPLTYETLEDAFGRRARRLHAKMQRELEGASMFASVAQQAEYDAIFQAAKKAATVNDVSDCVEGLCQATQRAAEIGVLSLDRGIWEMEHGSP